MDRIHTLLAIAALGALVGCRQAPGDDPSTGGEVVIEPPAVDTGGVEEPPGEPMTELVDEDGDGWFVGQDCDDSNALINPDAEEICDGADSNCDGVVDDAGLLTLIDAGTGQATNLGGGAVAVDRPGTLMVCEGEHAIALEVTSALVVAGAQEGAVLVGGAETPVSALGGRVRLVDVAIRGGAAGAVYCEDGDIELDGATVEGGAATHGGNLAAIGCDVFVENSLIADGAADEGANIYLDDSELVLWESRVEGGEAIRGGGLSINGGSEVIQRGTLVVGAGGESAVDVRDGRWECYGEDGLDSGVIGAEGAALSLSLSGDATMAGCDFGVGGEDENTVDLRSAYDDERLGNDVDITCYEGACYYN